MNKEIKEKWVAALRSGEYTQSKKRLRTGEGFCCLGVLCDLHQKETKEGFWENDGDDGDDYWYVPFIGSRSHFESTPRTVEEWAGIHSLNSLIYTHSLSHYNDVMNCSFNEIADLIEKNL